MFRTLSWYITLLVAAICFSGITSVSFAADDENCLMCHKYRKLGRITGEGSRRFYYVEEQEFMKTVHFNVRCRDCHYYIDQIPHAEVTEGVNCARQCHIKNPATGKYFSHKQIDDVYQKSAHARPKLPQGETADLQNQKPYCIYCHINPKYNAAEKELPKEITDRCVVCHEDDRWVEHWYSHTARRINQVKRSSKEVVELCSKCHSNQKYMGEYVAEKERLGIDIDENMTDEERAHKNAKFLEAGKSYGKSFHGAFNKMGWEKPANCLSCHADANNYYLSVHDIRNVNDPASTVHPDNRDKTCAKCHKGVGKNYAAIDEVHYSPHVNNHVEYIIEEFFFWLTSVSFFGLVFAITIDHHRKLWDKIRGISHHGSDH